MWCEHSDASRGRSTGSSFCRSSPDALARRTVALYDAWPAGTALGFRIRRPQALRLHRARRRYEKLSEQPVPSRSELDFLCLAPIARSIDIHSSSFHRWPVVSGRREELRTAPPAPSSERLRELEARIEAMERSRPECAHATSCDPNFSLLGPPFGGGLDDLDEAVDARLVAPRGDDLQRAAAEPTARAPGRRRSPRVPAAAAADVPGRHENSRSRRPAAGRALLRPGRRERAAGRTPPPR